MRNSLGPLPVYKKLVGPFKTLAQCIPTDRDAIIVASFGRAGSTLVYDSLSRGMARQRFGSECYPARKFACDPAFDLQAQSLRPGVVYKTHDYPEALKTGNRARAIFMFGSAIEAAISVYSQKATRGEEWVKLHFEHLRRSYRYDDLLKEDVLGFRDQCVRWMGYVNVPVLCVRYEGLWDNVDTLSEFCGFKVQLPLRRPRAPKKLDPQLLASTKAVYGQLDRDMSPLPDCFLAAPQYGSKMRLKGNN